MATSQTLPGENEEQLILSMAKLLLKQPKAGGIDHGNGISTGID
jgi:hypothetical protein